MPLLAKQDWPLVPPPDDALWKNSFNEAYHLPCAALAARRRQNWSNWPLKVGDWPTIWHNIAVLRTWLADTPGAIAAWQKYAAQPIPLDDAIEAEALAQSIDPEAVDLVDVLSIEYGVNDMEVLQARLTANPRALQMPIDLARMGTEDSPPPKGAFWLLSRAVPDERKRTDAGGCPAGRGTGVYVRQADRSRRPVGAGRLSHAVD